MADTANAQAAAPGEEQVKNCGSCGKPVKRLKRFYRNGKFYCNKVCFKKWKLKAKTEAAEAAAGQEQK
jgi:hypothetical protein